jgi:hypothetical protein
MKLNIKKNLFFIFVIILISLFFIKKKIEKENFANLPKEDHSCFAKIYDDKGNPLNIIAISKAFPEDALYKSVLTLKEKYLFLGISSYMEFPNVPSNPFDNYVDYADYDAEIHKDKNIFYRNMFLNICKGWLHCFREPEKFINTSVPNELISESDFCDYNSLQPKDDNSVEFDYLLNCPKVKDGNPCNDWVAYNKNWKLGKKVVELLSGKYGLKGLLVGRKDCKLSEAAEKNVEKTGWLDYGEAIKQYKRCKFIVLPNIVDASPRVLTEALCSDLPALVNYNILGGWKYINKQTGEFFTNEIDIETILPKFIKNLSKYTPRKYFIENYGPINSGIRLKNFIVKNYPDYIKNQNNIKYLTIRSPKINFKT